MLNVKESKHMEVEFYLSTLDEVERVFKEPVNEDCDCISLYDVAQYMNGYRLQFWKVKLAYEDKFNRLLRGRYGPKAFAYICDFNYEEKKLGIYGHSCEEPTYFTKTNGKLQILEQGCMSNEEAKLLSREVSSVYDELMTIFPFISDNNAYSINSRFCVNIGLDRISIYALNGDQNPYPEPILVYTPYHNVYKVPVDSGLIKCELHNKENELFSKIYIRISDCPKCCQENLYKIREEQLKLAKNKLANGMKKTRILENIKSFFH